jgi:hypothetical protein
VEVGVADQSAAPTACAPSGRGSIVSLVLERKELTMTFVLCLKRAVAGGEIVAITLVTRCWMSTWSSSLRAAR